MILDCFGLMPDDCVVEPVRTAGGQAADEHTAPDADEKESATCQS